MNIRRGNGHMSSRAGAAETFTSTHRTTQQEFVGTRSSSMVPAIAIRQTTREG